MGKLVVIRLGDGNFERGFPVLLQIAEDNKPYENLLEASLPGDSSLAELYQKLQENGLTALKPSLNKPLFKNILNSWLCSPQFLDKWSELLTNCTSQDIIRVILQTQDPELPKFPWHLWNFFDRYPLAEMAFSLSEYKIAKAFHSVRKEARILAILGNSEGIDTTVDEQEFKQLCPGTKFLPEENQERIYQHLRDEQSWDILFFAGHSKTVGEEGVIYINRTDSLKIEDLEYAVKRAINKGLKLAIFNSCDGLGLARTLASWNVPQVIVMRQPIPDEVAHKFLKFFIEALVNGKVTINDNIYDKTLYLAMREARENLQGLENKYPLASWLPVMYDQCFALNNSPTWKELNRISVEPKETASFSENQSSHDKLHQALQRLNYIDQVTLFRTVTEKYSVGACLIHGEEECGQKWLLNRLIKLVDNGKTAKVVVVNLNRKSRATYIQALWRELGGRVGLTGQCSPAMIIEKVSKWCQNQTVILVFDDLDRMPKECMNEFLFEFWLPLVQKVRDRISQSKYRLLMFLVDHSGCVEEWNVVFAQEINPDWEPYIPIKLPRIKPIEQKDLISWVRNAVDDLPLKFTNQMEEIVQKIFTNAETLLPEAALIEICRECDCNWYDWEEKWLKY